jgi:Tfp pilus assembly protein FimT
MKHSVYRRSNGFGLLDLMVTLVVFSLLAALAVPAYNGMINRGKVAGAIGDIAPSPSKSSDFPLTIMTGCRMT